MILNFIYFNTAYMLHGAFSFNPCSLNAFNSTKQRKIILQLHLRNDMSFNKADIGTLANPSTREKVINPLSLRHLFALFNRRVSVKVHACLQVIVTSHFSLSVPKCVSFATNLQCRIMEENVACVLTG